MASDLVKLPASQRAEEAVLGAILRDPQVTTEVVGSLLEPEHFYFKPYRVVYEEIIERHYADDTIDGLVIAEAVGKKVAGLWGISEREAVDKIAGLTEVKVGETAAGPVEHAGIIKRHSDYRALLSLGQRLQQAALEESDAPEVLAGAASAEAMKIATDMLLRTETYSYGDLGRRWVVRMREAIAAREAGIELGVNFGIGAIDDFTKGVKPTELLICGGQPGEGKSAVWWEAARGFARKQMDYPAEHRVGTFLCSIEMGEEPSSDRIAQNAGQIDGEKIRMGTLSRDELMNTAKRWAREKDIPLYTSHPSTLRCSQLRAMVVEEIRRHNCGVVIIDHFRMLKPDDKSLTGNDADDEVVRFLKMDLAKDLDCVVICLAHTTKTIDRQDKRPRASDLRGSGMIGAFADFVCFVHRPWKHATEQERAANFLHETDAEMLWEKSRHSGEGKGEFTMDLARMTIK